MIKVSKSIILHFGIQRFYINKNKLCKPFCKHKNEWFHRKFTGFCNYEYTDRVLNFGLLVNLYQLPIHDNSLAESVVKTLLSASEFLFL